MVLSDLEEKRSKDKVCWNVKLDTDDANGRRNVLKLLGKKYPMTKMMMMTTTMTMKKKTMMKTKIVTRKRKRKRRRNRALSSARSRSSVIIHSFDSSSEIHIHVIGKDTDLTNSYMSFEP
jgi:hypothetical protein